MTSTKRDGAAGRGPRAGASALGALGLAAAFALLPSAAGDPQEGVAEVDAARSALERWVEVRGRISAEERDWKLGREMLDERVGLVQREIDALRQRISDARGSIAEADERRAELLAENERLKTGAAALAERAAELEARTQALLARLPDPIRERVRPLSQRIPAPEKAEERSLGERFQNVVGILNEVDKFHREITVTSEVRALPDGTAAEVAALYAGLGQAWYVSPNGAAAGVGRAGAEGWTWTPADEAAPDVAAAIAILKNEQVAAFVRLPAHVE